MDMSRDDEIDRDAERRKNMRNQQRVSMMAKMMTALGAIGAGLAVVMRVWLAPAQRDIDTGLFTSNTTVIWLLLAAVAGLAALAFLMRGCPRQEITQRSVLLLSVALLAVGAVMTLFGGVEMLARLGIVEFYTVRKTADPVTTLSTAMQWLQTVFCLLGGVALVRYGLVLASEGATRRGSALWSLLAPVLWLWFTLANYEMSYASMVRLSDGFFTLMMYIFEMVFLFAFARYMSGVGKMSVGMLLFCSGGATLFALSAPLVRIFMYLLQDVEAFAANGAPGPLDLAVGVLALVTAVSLCRSLDQAPPSDEEEDAPAWSVSEDADVDLIDMSDEGTDAE